MPRSSDLLTRIAPEYLPLWRDGDTLQFGASGSIRVRVEEPWVERVVSRLCGGIRLASFDVVAHRLGAPRQPARALLAELRPVMRTDFPPPPAAWVENANITDSRVGSWMLAALAGLAVPEAARTDPAAVGVILVHGAVSAVQMSGYLRDDVAHLPVAFEPGGVNIGPLVVPGRTPCLSCRDSLERDRDPAWPLLHCQLVGRETSAVPQTLVMEAAVGVERLLRSEQPPDAVSTILRISADGTRSQSRVMFHAECRCREQSFRSPQENETPSADLDPQRVTRTA